MGRGEATTPSRTIREDVAELRRLIKRSLAFWGRALGIVVVAAIVTGALVVRTPPIYRSETLILYQEAIRSSDVTSGEGGSENARRIGARLREALMSRTSLDPIITELHLFARPGADRHDLIDAAEEMRSRITFKAREGDTFVIAFDGDTAFQAQEVTRRLAERIVQYAATRRSHHAKTLKEFLDSESERNEIALRTREAAFAQFLAAHPEYAPPPSADGRAPRKPVAAPRTDDPALIALEVRAARIEQRLKAADGSARPAAPARVAPAPDGPEVTAARKDLSDKMLRFTDRHPDVVAARERLAAAEETQARTRAAAAAEAAAEAAAASDTSAPLTNEERAELTQRLNVLRAEIATRRGMRGGLAADAPLAKGADEHGAVASEVEFRRLEREVLEARERQRQLDDKQFKATITASLVADDRNIQVSVLDPAYLPTHPISRSRRLLALGGAVAGLVIAMLVALVSARLDDRLFDRSDIAALDLVPVLAVIPAPLALPRGKRRGEEDP